MNHIRVLTGPMEGRTFELRGHTATVGRAPENDIRLDDPTVSRRHALISLKRDRYAIKDLGSHNGTWVNGRPLKPGTEVPLEEGIPVVIGSVQVSLGSPRTDDGLVNRYAISLFGKGGEINGTQLYKDRRITKRENLERIYEVSTTLMQSLDIDEICAKIMDSLFSSLKRIDSGAILLFNPETSELKVLISRSRYSRNSIKILYSRTIVSRVIREGKAVMLSDTGQAPEEDLSESMEVMKIQSVMCVPLIAKSEVRGVIYVHSVNVPYGFRKDDLCLLTALSSPAALALENALLYSGARRTEEALRRSEEKYRVLVENAGEAIVLLREGRIGFANPRAEKLLGNPCEELLQTPFIDLCHPGDRDLFRERHDRCLRQADSAPLTFRIMKGDREPVWVQGIGTPVDCDGEPCTLYFLRDVTGQKTLEDQLLQARKMEAIGTLAAGVAHDFNNLLMGIQGNASLMLLDTDNRHPHYQKLKNIETCVAKGAEITEQMLGFAMEGKYHVETTSLNDLVSRSAKVLSRNNKDIRIAVNLEEDLWPVDIDRRQMDQVLINLYMHAWHSMPAGGEIRLKTANASFAAEVARELGLEPGGYVKLTFSDNGLGLDEKTTKRIFEPFFTSKEMGRGIGLGLASVYGIVKNHGGMITVEGRKGEGTTFILYLPRSKGTLNPSLGVGVPPAESREETRIPPSNPENLMQESAPN